MGNMIEPVVYIIGGAALGVLVHYVALLFGRTAGS